MANDLFAMKSPRGVPEQKEVQNSSNEPGTSPLVVQQVSVRDIVQVDPVCRHGSSSRSGTPRSREEPDGGEGVERVPEPKVPRLSVPGSAITSPDRVTRSQGSDGAKAVLDAVCADSQPADGPVRVPLSLSEEDPAGFDAIVLEEGPAGIDAIVPEAVVLEADPAGVVRSALEEEDPAGFVRDASEEAEVLIDALKVRHVGAGVGDGGAGRRRASLAPSAQVRSSHGSVVRCRSQAGTRSRIIRDPDRALTGRSPTRARSPAKKRVSSADRNLVVRRLRPELPDGDNAQEVQWQADGDAGARPLLEGDVNDTRRTQGSVVAVGSSDEEVRGERGALMIHETLALEYLRESALVCFPESHPAGA